MQRPPIFLVGFMCSGKTRIGRELAQLLGLRHIDLDRRIEEQVGPLQVYFARRGEEAFRDLEREVLLGLLNVGSVVISTGGGTPIAFDNMQHMRTAGTVVYLDVPMEELMPRIVRSGGDRPLLMGLNGEALEQRVASLLAEREPAYEQAHIKVDGSGQASEVAARIAASLSAQAK